MSATSNKKTAFIDTVRQVAQTADERTRAQEARLSAIQEARGNNSRHSCEYFRSDCKTKEDHRAHETIAKILAIPDVSIDLLLTVLRQNLMLTPYVPVSAELVERYLTHPEINIQRIEQFAFTLARSSTNPGFTPSDPSPLEVKLGISPFRLRKPPVNPIEVLLGFPGLSVKTLKNLAKAEAMPPEAVLLFLEQENCYPLLAVTLFVSTRSNAANSHSITLADDLKDAFTFAPPAARVAIALSQLDPKLNARELMSCANRILNDLNRDRNGALEMAEVMAKEWLGTLEEFEVMVKALV